MSWRRARSPMAWKHRRRVSCGAGSPCRGRYCRWGRWSIIADATVSDAELDAFVAGFVITDSGPGAQAAAPEYRTIEVDGLTIRYQVVAPAVCNRSAPGTPAWIWRRPAQLAAQRGSAGHASQCLPGRSSRSWRLVQGGRRPRRAGGNGEWIPPGPRTRRSQSRRAFARRRSRPAAGPRRPVTGPDLSLIAPAGLGERINDEYIGGFLHARRHRELKPIVEMLFHNQRLVTRDMIEDLLKARRIDGAERRCEPLPRPCCPTAGRRSICAIGSPSCPCPC